MTEAKAKARESRLRRLAASKGYALEKSRLRKAIAPDFGRFRLVCMKSDNQVGLPEFIWSLDDVERQLLDMPNGDPTTAQITSLLRQIDKVDTIERKSARKSPRASSNLKPQALSSSRKTARGRE